MHLGETGEKSGYNYDAPDCKTRKGPKCPECPECTSATWQKRLVDIHIALANPLLELKHMESRSPCGRPLLDYAHAKLNRWIRKSSLRPPLSPILCKHSTQVQSFQSSKCQRWNLNQWNRYWIWMRRHLEGCLICRRWLKQTYREKIRRYMK